jgi:hypothetical protein
MKELMNEWMKYVLKEETQRTQINIIIAAYGYLLEVARRRPAQKSEYLRGIGELGRYIKDQKFSISDPKALRAIQIIKEIKYNEVFEEFYNYGNQVSKSDAWTAAPATGTNQTAPAAAPATETNQTAPAAAPKPTTPAPTRETYSGNVSGTSVIKYYKTQQNGKDYIAVEMQTQNGDIYIGYGRLRSPSGQELAREAAEMDARAKIVERLPPDIKKK